MADSYVPFQGPGKFSGIFKRAADQRQLEKDAARLVEEELSKGVGFQQPTGMLDNVASEAAQAEAAAIREAEEAAARTAFSQAAPQAPINSSLGKGSNLEKLEKLRDALKASEARGLERTAQAAKTSAENIVANRSIPGYTAADSALFFDEANMIPKKSAAKSAEVFDNLVSPNKYAADSAEVFNNLVPPNKYAEDSAGVFKNLVPKSKYAADSAKVFEKAVPPSKYASDSAQVFEKGMDQLEADYTKDVARRARQVNINPIDELLNQPRNAPVGIGPSNLFQQTAEQGFDEVGEAAAKSPSLLKRFGSGAARVAEKAGEVAAQYPRTMTGLKVAGKVAGPALAAYDLLESEDAGANSDLVQGPMMTARELQNSEIQYADTDQVPETRAIAAAPSEEFGPPAPSLLPDSPKGPNLFDRVSGVLGSKDMTQETPKVPGLAKGQAALKASGKSSAVSPGPSKPTERNSVEEKARIEADQGYQLGTKENLEKAQSNSSFLNSLATLSASGSDALNAAVAAGDKITNGSSGKVFGTAAADGLRQKGKAEIDNHNALVENQKNDPKSQTSAEMRNLVREMGFPVSDNVSGADLDKKFAGLTNIYTQRKAQEARAEQAELNRENQREIRRMHNETLAANARIAAENRKESKEQRMDDKNRGFVQGLRKEATTGENAKSYRAYLTSNRVERALSEFMKNPTGYSDYATLMGGLKSLQGDESVVREAEMKLGINAADLGTKINNYFQQMKSGTSLQPKQREDIVNTVKILTSIAKDQYQTGIQPLVSQAQAQGFDMNQIVNEGMLQPAAEEKPMTKESAEAILNKDKTYPVEGKAYRTLAPAPVNERKVGEIKTLADGRKVQWDGKGYKAVK